MSGVTFVTSHQVFLEKEGRFTQAPCGPCLEMEGEEQSSLNAGLPQPWPHRNSGCHTFMRMSSTLPIAASD